MSITILSSRELNQDVSRVKKAASQGPVIITFEATGVALLNPWEPAP